VLIGVALASAVLVTGCGSGKAAPTTVAKAVRPARSDKLRVYFRPSATRTQERSDGDRLRGEPCVRRVVFVSKGQALKLMQKQFPNLFTKRTMTRNPLPDSFTVTAGKLSCVSTIGASVAHWPGVATVRWKT
jgi:cell division protein FtsX